MRKKYIYADHASITPIDPSVLKVVEKTQKKFWHNPSSIHEGGVLAKKELNKARVSVARILHCRENEIYFTGSGTEANNLAIYGVLSRAKARGMNGELIVSNIEHPATSLSAQRANTELGVELLEVPVKAEGLIDLQALKLRVNPQTVLISLIHANNEIGVIQDVRSVKRFLQTFKKALGRGENDYPYLHIDCAQSPNYLSINKDILGADLISLDGGKIYGPRGVGCLYVNSHVPIQPLIVGGGQESGLRSGTENLPAIVGFAHALELAQKNFEKEAKRICVLRDKLAEGLMKIVADLGLMAHVNGQWSVGDYENRLANNINICFEDSNSELLVLRFDAMGVAISSASSCKHLDDESSSLVVQVLGDPACASSSLRFTLGKSTKLSDIKQILSVAKEIFSKHSHS